jgi:hypothetical protein
LILVLFAATPFLRAEEDVNPATKPGQVQITFLPPPMEGTVSLGIYTKAGKLVRALKREAVPEKDFVVGLNGLITIWDGKDDKGAAAPKGVYSVRGYMVHAIEVSGEAFHGNDWITADDAPHPKEINAIALQGKDEIAMFMKLADGSPTWLACGMDGALHKPKERVSLAAETQKLEGLMVNPGIYPKPLTYKLNRGRIEFNAVGDGTPLPELHQVLQYDTGKDESVWVINHPPGGTEVHQYSAKGEFLRRLSIAAGEPVPVKIAASTASDLIFLLEKGEGIQRVRGLALETLKNPLPSDPAVEGEPKSSTWRIVFSKTIRACDDFATAAPYLGRAEIPKPETTLAIKLAKNPLGKKVEPTMECTVVCEPTGSFLHTADGLPLCRLTDTPGLKWAVLTRTDKALSLIQSDGAVVEEYKLGKLTSMMAFDAGEYELK